MHEDLLPCKTMLTVNSKAAKAVMAANTRVRPGAHGVLQHVHIKLTLLTTTRTQTLFAV